MRYYIVLTRFSSRNSFLQVPYDYCSNTYLDEHPNARIWFLELLRKSASYYQSQRNLRGSAFRLPWGLEIMIELIPWLDEQKIFYHFEFTYEQANANTFDEGIVSEYWNYYKYKMMLVIPEDVVAIVKLYFPKADIKIEN